MEDKRFQYSVTRPKLTLQKLDELAEFVFSGNTKGLGLIGAGLKLILALSYIFARKYLFDAEMEVAKQEYEIKKHSNNTNDLDKDNLD